MARHRNVRSMNFSDEYDGYDDVYGHSVEDDYCMSPTDAAFMYDREGSKNQQKIGAFFKEIAEEDEREQDPELQGLSEVDRARIESCIEQMKSAIDPSVTKHEMVKALLDCHFNVEKAVNYLLDNNQPKQTERKEKGDILLFTRPLKGFAVPKLTKFNIKSAPHFLNNDDQAESNHFNLFVPHKISLPSKVQNKSDSDKFSSLADLTNSHLQKVKFQIPSPFKNKNAFKTVKTDSEDVNKISNNISNIKLTETDGITSNQDFTNRKNSNKVRFNKLGESLSASDLISDDEIDLLKAVRTTKSVPLITSKKHEVMQEDFELPFVDCDPVLEDHKMPTDFCTLDCSYVLQTPSTGAKHVSKFGKVLACKYKRFVPYIASKSPCKIKRFSFDTASPDDLVLRHLRKK